MILSGVLLTPTGVPYKNSTIQITAKNTSASVLKATTKEFKTGVDGSYSIDVPNGWYYISVLESRTSTNIGNIEITDDTTITTINGLLMLGQTAGSDPLVAEVAASAALAVQSKNQAAESATVAESFSDATIAAYGSVQSILRMSDVEGLAISLTDASNVETWLEAEDVHGGPSQLSLKHLQRTTGVGLLTDAYGYSIAGADPNGLLTDLAYDDETGQVAEFVMKRWAARLTGMGVGGNSYPNTLHNNVSQMRNTRMKFGQLRSGDVGTQLHIAFVGDSYTDGFPYYLQELTRDMVKDWGFAGIGYIGLAQSSSLGNSSFIYNTIDSNYFGGGWTISALGTASPTSRTISSSTAGSYCVIQAQELGGGITTLITAGKLMYLGDGTNPVVRYRWSDTGPWNNLTLTGNGPQSINLDVLPDENGGLAWKFRLELVSGSTTLFGVFFNNSNNGIINSKLASSGSASGDWYHGSDSAWITQFKASLALLPIAPHCFMIMLGGNDQSSNISPANYLTNIQGLIDNIKAVYPAADIHVTNRADTSRTSLYPMSAYAEVTQKWCWENNIPYTNLQLAFGPNPNDYATGGILPLIDVDKAHPIPTTGGRLITEAFYRLFRTAQ